MGVALLRAIVAYCRRDFQRNRAKTNFIRRPRVIISPVAAAAVCVILDVCVVLCVSVLDRVPATDEVKSDEVTQEQEEEAISGK